MAYPGSYSTSNKYPPQQQYSQQQYPPQQYSQQQYSQQQYPQQPYPQQQYASQQYPPQQYPPQQYSHDQGQYSSPSHFPPPPYPGNGPPPPSGYQQQQQYAPPYPVAPQGYAPPQQQQQVQPFYQYSNCTGTKKALLVGINYFGGKNALAGCINDVHAMRDFLIQRYGYKHDDMVILTDDQKDLHSIPTRDNILRAMQWLVSEAKPNDSLFFHYSGHGGQVADINGDEDDGSDECIYPIDHEISGPIIDDIMHDIMVKPLPPGCRLTAIFDSCHSGTTLDLPYIYSTKGIIKEPNLLADAGSGLKNAGMSYMRGDILGVVSNIGGFAKKAMNGGKSQEMTRQTKFSPADVIMWSGCKDSQTSADAVEAGRNTGAMSWAFQTALNKYPQQSYIQLLNTIRDELAGKYSQKPQLSASHPMDLSQMFIM